MNLNLEEHPEKEEERYSIKEISAATNIPEGTLHTRRKDRGITPNRAGYMLDEVKIIVKRPKKKVFNEARAKRLRARLLNDGAL